VVGYWSLFVSCFFVIGYLNNIGGENMKKLHFLILLLVLSIFLYGCITTKKVTKSRMDQELEGNVGYIKGRPCKTELSEPVNKQREYFEIDVELPPFPELREHYWRDDKIWGNKGYLEGKPR